MCQVGDSRAYLVRDGQAIQITKDQSLMQKLVEAGEMTAEEAEVSERRNIILQALGPEPIVKVDLTSQQVKRGDVLVLCSDGLSGQVRASEIAEVVRTEPDLVHVCKKLIDLANEAGGPDNITVIAARFEGSGLMETGAEQPAHRIYRGSQEQRATVQVERGSIPQHAIAEPDEAPTLETEQAARPAAAPKPASAAASTAASVAQPKLPPPPPPGGRVPRDYLRIAFGAIALLVLGFYVLRWLTH